MTAKPVPEHIDMRVATDEQLRTFVDAIAAAFPGELTEPRKVLAEVSRRLTELQHRREAEAGAPEGWVLVPREPTIDMASAGWDAIMAHTGFHEVDDRAEKAYRAMLAASPSSPASGVRVKVKPLEWHGPDFEDEYWSASLDLKYVIHPPNERGVRWLGGVGGYFRLVDEAKAVAEKHNEARIRSALGEHP